MNADQRAHVLGTATKFYQRMLKGKARKYLVRERGLSTDAIERFRIGFAPVKPGLLRYLKKQGVKRSEAVQAGLFKKRGSEFHQFFRNRIIFPVIRRGKVMNLIGRELPRGKDD